MAAKTETTDNKITAKTINISDENTLNISYSSRVFKPEFIRSRNSLVIRSPLNLKIMARNSVRIDTELKINCHISSFIQTSSVFKDIGLVIQDKEHWYLNKTKWDTIMLHLQNINFYNNIFIRKGDIICYLVFNSPFFIEIKYNQY